MEVLESRALAPGQALHLVRMADRVMVLASHAGGCTLLESRSWPLEAESSRAGPHRAARAEASS